MFHLSSSPVANIFKIPLDSPSFQNHFSSPEPPHLISGIPPLFHYIAAAQLTSPAQGHCIPTAGNSVLLPPASVTPTHISSCSISPWTHFLLFQVTGISHFKTVASVLHGSWQSWEREQKKRKTSVFFHLYSHHTSVTTLIMGGEGGPSPHTKQFSNRHRHNWYPVTQFHSDTIYVEIALDPIGWGLSLTRVPLLQMLIASLGLKYVWPIGYKPGFPWPPPWVRLGLINLLGRITELRGTLIYFYCFFLCRTLQGILMNT